MDNYLIYKFFYINCDSLPLKYLEARAEYEKIFTGVSSLSGRTKYCTDLTFEKLPLAVGKLFVEKYFDSNSKHKVKMDLNKNFNVVFIYLKLN